MGSDGWCERKPSNPSRVCPRSEECDDVRHSGRSGHVASATAQAFLEAGEPVTVVLHSPDGTWQWRRRGADAAMVDARDSDALREILRKDGSWDGRARRIGLNVRLIDDFAAADWPVAVIDGKNLW